MADHSRLSNDNHAEAADEPAQAAAAENGAATPEPGDAQLSWARALEVCRRRFVQRRSAEEIKQSLGLPDGYYEGCMRWLLRGVRPRVSAGDCAYGFDRRLVDLAEADLIGIAAVQGVNDHLKECADCASYLHGLRKAAHIFITSDEHTAGSAKAAYVKPSVHASQVQGLRRKGPSPERDESSGRAAGAERPVTARPKGKRKRAGRGNAPLMGAGFVAAATAVGVTLVPSQPPNAGEMQRAANPDDRSSAQAARNVDPGAAGAATSFDETGPPSVRGAEPAAFQGLEVPAREQLLTPASDVAPASDGPEVSLPVSVAAPGIDLATHEAGIAAAKTRMLAAQHAANAATRTILDDAATAGASGSRPLSDGTSTGSTAVASVHAEQNADAVAQVGSPPVTYAAPRAAYVAAPVSSAPDAGASTRTAAALAKPVSGATASATSTRADLALANRAPDATTSATSTQAEPAPADALQAALAGGPAHDEPADEHSARAMIDNGAGSPDAQLDPAASGTSPVDMTPIVTKIDEVRETLRAGLAEHAGRLQASLSDAMAAAGDVPTAGHAASNAPQAAPVAEPATPNEPPVAPVDEAAVPMDPAQPAPGATVEPGPADAGSGVI